MGTLKTFLVAGIGCAATVTASSIAYAAAPDPYLPLRLYEGGWKVMADGKTTPDRLVDDCATAGRFFACQQTLNGKPGALVIFIPTSAGHYHTQVVLPDGSALGAPGALTISGDHWVYLSGPDSKGIWYRTTNDFQGHDRIRFAVAHSTDGRNWIVTLSGVEQRAR